LLKNANGGILWGGSVGINVSDLLVALDSDHQILVVSDKRDNMPTQFKWVQRSIMAMFGDLVMEQTKNETILENGSRIHFMSYRSTLRGYHPDLLIICNNHLIPYHPMSEWSNLVRNCKIVKEWKW